MGGYNRDHSNLQQGGSFQAVEVSIHRLCQFLPYPLSVVSFELRQVQPVWGKGGEKG